MKSHGLATRLMEFVWFSFGFHGCCTSLQYGFLRFQSGAPGVRQRSPPAGALPERCHWTATPAPNEGEASAAASRVRRVNGQWTTDRLDVGHIELDRLDAEVATDMNVMGATGLD
jgi:hypothetical protein